MPDFGSAQRRDEGWYVESRTHFASGRDGAEKNRAGRGSFPVTYRSGLEETLELARTGLWTIEMEEGLRAADVCGQQHEKTAGSKSDISPEECYRAWYDRIEPGYEEAVQASVDEMLSSGRSEVAYPWNHPTQGQTYVQCGGVHDKSFEYLGFRLKGYHQDITQTVAINKQQEKELERANIILKRQLKVTQSLGSI